MRSFHVVYLTGAPASGKSTLVTALEKVVSPVTTFRYSKMLADFIASKTDGISHLRLRQESAGIVTKEDIETVDSNLIEQVSDCRKHSHVIIDSHPVTKESFGFRITPFSLDQLLRIAPTLILNLYAAPEVLLDRIEIDPQGRPSITAYEAGYHNALQGAVAIAYGIHVGAKIYMLDSAKPTAELVEQVCKRLN